MENDDSPIGLSWLAIACGYTPYFRARSDPTSSLKALGNIAREREDIANNEYSTTETLESAFLGDNCTLCIAELHDCDQR